MQWSTHTKKTIEGKEDQRAQQEECDPSVYYMYIQRLYTHTQIHTHIYLKLWKNKNKFKAGFQA